MCNSRRLVRWIFVSLTLVLSIQLPLDHVSGKRFTTSKIKPKTDDWGSKILPICPKINGIYQAIPLATSSEPREDENLPFTLPGPQGRTGPLVPLESQSVEANTMRAKSCIDFRVTFDWSRKPRFGLDQNRNGIIDLPNTSTYVQNGGPSDQPPTFEVSLMKKSTFSQAPSFLRTSPPEYSTSWHVRSLTSDDTSASVSVFQGTERNEDSLPLPEGEYEVELRHKVKFPRKVFVLSPTSPNMIPLFSSNPPVEGQWVDALEVSFKKKIYVEDILIVSIGDSLSSGEGNPELRTPVSEPDCLYGKQVQWADDGVGSTDFVKMCGNVETVTTIDESDGSQHTNSKDVYTISNETDSGIAKTHIRAHRSTAAWSAQVALALEKANPQSSVTFVSLASTGAQISKGILKPSKGSMDEGIELSAGEGTVRQIWRKDGFHTDIVFNPQIEELANVIGNRTIDLLLISVGGNDIGFSLAARALMIKGHWSSGLLYGHIWDAVYDGDWSTAKKRALDRGIGKKGADGQLGKGSRPGMHKLFEDFRKLAEALEPSNFTIGQTVIIEYPDFTTGPWGATCGAMMKDAGIAKGIWGSPIRPGDVWIDDEEAIWAVQNILVPLNLEIARAADAHNWIFVDGIQETFLRHGYCAQQPYSSLDFQSPFPLNGYSEGRWIRRAGESQHIQGIFGPQKTKGALHPNEYGHRAIKEKVLEKLVEERIINSNLILSR